MSYYFARQTHTQDEIQFDLQREDGSTIGVNAIVDWKYLFRETCAWFFVNDPVVIGGPGKFVEIDETVLTKRKYHRGQLRAEEKWFFGGVERGNAGNCFIRPVERRNAETLLPLLAMHVAPGTTVISDKWAAYGGMSVFLIYKVVIRLIRILVSIIARISSTPRTRKYTRRRLNARGPILKLDIRKRGEQHLFETYLYQFLWFKKFKGPDVLYHL